MVRRGLALGLLLVGGSAFAYGPYGPGPGPCGGYITSHWVVQPSFGGEVVIGGPDSAPVNTPNEGHGASSPGGNWGGGGGGSGKEFLILAVVAVAALPVVVYAFDAPATQDIGQCWMMPREQFNFYGGSVGSDAGAVGFFGFRGGFSAAVFGLSVAAEGNGFGYRDLSAALALRAYPKQHIDIALSFGVRQVLDGVAGRNWVELALPHRYQPFRQDAMNPGLGIEVRPALLIGSQVFDARIDAGLVIPFGPWASLDLGGRVYSFESSIRFGAQAGLQFSL